VGGIVAHTSPGVRAAPHGGSWYAWPMVRRLILAGLALLSVGLGGCAGKERVSLSVTVSDADLEVQEGLFGTFLSGTVELRLQLGPDAPGSTEAELESLKLLRASDDLELVPVLSLTSAFTPISLGPGDAQTRVLELDASAPLASTSMDEICAEPVKVHGSVTDTLSDGRSTPFGSPGLTPAGCP
jgi:hypothetical protein